MLLRSLGKLSSLPAQCRARGNSLVSQTRSGQHGRLRKLSVSAVATGMAYKVESLTKDRVPAAADIVLEAFSYDDEYSMSRALNAPREGFPYWMRGVYMPACSQHGAGSIVAVSADTGELGGVLTLEDMNEDIEEVFKQASGGAAAEEPPLTEEAKAKAAEREAALAPLLGILDGCKEIFWREYAARGGSAAERGEKRKGKFAYLGFLAVSAEHRRWHVGATLVAHSSTKLAAQGFEYSVAFCTSYRSKALFAKEGFEYWGGERYRTFTFNGRTWFESLPDDEIAVMVKRIAAK